MLRNGRLVRGATACALLTACVIAAPAAESYRVRLTTVPIETSTAADVTGSGAATVVLDGRRLSITGSFEGLQGSATVARLHEGPAKAVRGPAIFDLSVTAGAEGSVSGVVELSRAQVESLRQGRLYLQIHSERAPEGNLWGWILP